MSKKSYKVKLKVKSKVLQTSLKRMAGCYRSLYNFCINFQANHVILARDIKDRFLTSKELLEAVLAAKDENFPYIGKFDSGILYAAVATASRAFLKTFDYHLDSIHFLSRKKGNMKFKTKGKVKFLEGAVVVPKLGAISIYEKGYIPVNASKYTNITFSHDGSDWFLSVDVEAKDCKKSSTLAGELSLDFTKEGDYLFDNSTLRNCKNQQNYKVKEKQLKRLLKKLKRQTKANCKFRGQKAIPVKTQNMKKTLRKINKVKTTLSNRLKDSQKKIICEVSRLQPERFNILSKEARGKTRNGYLSRKLRRAEVLTFLSMLIRKLNRNGVKINYCESFNFPNKQTSLGYKAYACGGLYKYRECSQKESSVKQELPIGK